MKGNVHYLGIKYAIWLLPRPRCPADYTDESRKKSFIMSRPACEALLVHSPEYIVIQLMAFLHHQAQRNYDLYHEGMSPSSPSHFPFPSRFCVFERTVFLNPGGVKFPPHVPKKCYLMSEASKPNPNLLLPPLPLVGTSVVGFLTTDSLVFPFL